MSNYPGALSGGFVSHRFQSLKSDQPDLSVINPSNWNQSHIIGSGAIQSGALGGAVVGSGNLISGSVIMGSLSSGAVQSGALGANVVTSGNVASGAVLYGALTSGVVISGILASGAVPWKPFVVVSQSGPGDGGDYGPGTVGTGTAGIQEAVNALAAKSGGIAFLRDNSYILNSGIVGARGVYIVGASRYKSTITGASGFSVYVVSGMANPYHGLMELQLTGNGGADVVKIGDNNNASFPGIVLQGLTISQSDATYANIHLTQVADQKMEDIICTNNSGPIFIWDGNTNYGNTKVGHLATVGGTAGTALQFTNVSHASFEYISLGGGKITASGNIAVKLVGCSDLNFLSADFEHFSQLLELQNTTGTQWKGFFAMSSGSLAPFCVHFTSGSNRNILGPQLTIQANQAYSNPAVQDDYDGRGDGFYNVLSPTTYFTNFLGQLYFNLIRSGAAGALPRIALGVLVSGTVYQNTFGRNVYVYTIATFGSGGGNIVLGLDVISGAGMSTPANWTIPPGSASGFATNLGFFVPNGWYFTLTSSGASLGTSNALWT